MSEQPRFSRMEPVAVFLCDLTGNMARPWAEAGIRCYCVDTQHSIRRDRVEGNIHFVWGDVRSWMLPAGTRQIFVAAFTPCTHVAGSGARDFRKKRGYLLRDAIEMFEAGRQVASWSGAPYLCENSVGLLSSLPHIGAPDHYFDPCDFTGWCAEDNYTKKTCLWVGNGFVMPPRFKDMSLSVPDDRIHKATPGPERENFRSATPMGFARATFHANCPIAMRIAA